MGCVGKYQIFGICLVNLPLIYLLASPQVKERAEAVKTRLSSARMVFYCAPIEGDWYWIEELSQWRQTKRSVPPPFCGLSWRKPSVTCRVSGARGKIFQIILVDVLGDFETKLCRRCSMLQMASAMRVHRREEGQSVLFVVIVRALMYWLSASNKENNPLSVDQSSSLKTG